jgi:hypothetical protein
MFAVDPIPVAGEIRRDRGEGYCIKGNLEGCAGAGFARR